MTRRYVLLALLLMGGVLVAGIAWFVIPKTTLLKMRCEMGDVTGCLNLGVMYADGQGVTQDDFQAADLYRKGCDGGSARGMCYSRLVT